MTRRLLVTGGSGYLGGELVRRSAVPGWQTIATYHINRPDVPADDLIQIDLRDAPAAERRIAALQPEIIIHTAYLQGGADLWPVTVEGSTAVARAARAAGARLVQLSSDVIFDGERTGSYGDDDRPAPISSYGEAKAAAERDVAAIAPEALIVRTSLIYGGELPSKHEQLALDAAAGLIDIAVYTDELRCPIQVTDLADALLELAVQDVAGTLNVAGGDTVSRYEFAQLVVAAAGSDPAGLRSAASAGSGVRRPRNCALDSRRAQELIRTRLRGAREVLRPPV